MKPGEIEGWPGEGCLCKSNVRGVEDAGSGELLSRRSKRPDAKALAENPCGMGGGSADRGWGVRGVPEAGDGRREEVWAVGAGFAGIAGISWGIESIFEYRELDADGASVG